MNAQRPRVGNYFSWGPRQKRHRPATRVRRHNVFRGEPPMSVWSSESAEVATISSAVPHVGCTLLRGSERRRFFQQLESNISYKQHTPERGCSSRLRQEERQENLRVILREPSCLILVDIACLSVAGEREAALRSPFAISVMTQISRRQNIYPSLD